jgi:hypothetical protein
MKSRSGGPFAGQTEIFALDVGLQRPERHPSAALAIELGDLPDAPGKRSTENAHF